MLIDTYENGGVWRSGQNAWLAVVELKDMIEVTPAVNKETPNTFSLTIPEAEALVRHLRRAIRRQKARAAQ